MKKLCLPSLLLVFVQAGAFAQDSTFLKFNEWLKDNNFSIRKTFDGSVNENKPAGIAWQENHKSDNDFINIDLAVKLSEFPILKNVTTLMFYPKIEWHKSNDSTDRKNKLDGGINVEFFPFLLKDKDSPPGVKNKGSKVAPWFQGTSSFKRNFIDDVYETKLAFQVSASSNFDYYPGYYMRDSKGNLRARYYPYVGVEYNRTPGLITKEHTEEFSTFFVRLFAELWIFPEALQLTLDGTYREIVNNTSALKTALPVGIASLYLYPGKQESIAVGYEYKHGYEPDSKYRLVQISSIKLSVKI